MSNKIFQDKVVLITGAGRGAGRKLAEAFAAEGAIIAANDITPINLEPVVAGITASGARARAYVHDIAKKVDVQAMVNHVTDDFGHIDILLNCANVQISTSLLEIDEWDLHRIFEVNAIGTILVMQSVGRVMRSQGSGIIVNVVKIPENAPAIYMASRAGLTTMTEQIQSEFKNYGLQVLAVTDEDPLKAVFLGCQV